MPLNHSVPSARTILAGSTWTVRAYLTDEDGYYLYGETVTCAVTAPDGTPTTPDVWEDLSGYAARVSVNQVGRWLAVMTATIIEGIVYSAGFAAYADMLTNDGMPTVADAIYYLESIGVSRDEEEIADAFTAEQGAQTLALRLDTLGYPDVRAALLRRTAVHLARKRIPLGILAGDADTGQLVLPRNDPEVRRLEGPYRRVTIG